MCHNNTPPKYGAVICSWNPLLLVYFNISLLQWLLGKYTLLHIYQFNHQVNHSQNSHIVHLQQELISRKVKQANKKL